MTRSLDSIGTLRKHILQAWLKENLNENQFFEFLEQDSCPLSEAVCFLFGRFNCSEIEDPSRWADFVLDVSLVAESLSLDKAFIFEYANRLIKTYNKAVRAIEGDILWSNRSQTIPFQATSFVRYWVKPRDVLLWAYNKGVMKTPQIEDYIKKNIAPKPPGRPLIKEDEQILNLLIDLSRQEEFQSYTAEKLCSHPKAETIFSRIYKKLDSDKRQGKKERLIKKLRQHSDFGGVKRSKKKVKSPN